MPLRLISESHNERNCTTEMDSELRIPESEARFARKISWKSVTTDAYTLLGLKHIWEVLGNWRPGN